MADNTHSLSIEQLYIAVTGQMNPGSNGMPPVPNRQLLARSPGVRPEQIVECQKLAFLTPPIQTSDKLQASVGLFRADTVDYILVKARRGSDNTTYLHYLLIPSVILRWLGGNLHRFEAFGSEPIPQFSLDRIDLPTYALDNPQPPDSETQTDDLLALIRFCNNELRIVGGLLAGLVQAMGLGIINAPLSLRDRLTFVQGLLTMLPIPARTAITFATSVTDPVQTRTQIKFLETDVRPDNHLIFDWKTGKLLDNPPDDAYSKYILTQLRLDTSLVIEQTERMARTAVWRAMRKDDMANALAWISKRGSLDEIVRNGQPADIGMVASVLREDPTLPDDLRVSYTQHLLAFSLALNDASQTDIIPSLAAQNQDVASAVYEQLEAAAKSDQAQTVYKLIEDWILHPPMGAEVSRWRPLLGTAALTRHQELINGEMGPLVAFMEKFIDAPPALQMERVIVQMLGLCYKRSYTNAEMGRVTFLLAITYLPIGGLQRLLGDPQLTAQLPASLRTAFPYLMPNPDRTQPPSLLSKAAEAYGREYQPLVLGRLIEWAFLIQRIDLLDADALRGLVKVATSPRGARFDQLMQNIVQDLSRLNIVKTLDVPSQQHLVNLSLARGRFDEAILQLVFYQDQVYKPSDQDKAAAITRAVFRETPLDIKSLLEVLDMLQSSQLRSIMRIYAHIGALEGQNWSTDMEPATRRLTAIFFGDPRLIALSGIEPVVRLLKANADRRDAVEALNLTTALVDFAATLIDQNPNSNQGIELISRAYALVNWSPQVDDAVLEILRTYIRRAPLDMAKNLAQSIGEKYGIEKQRSLEAAYCLRLAVSGTDFATFNQNVHTAKSLFFDMASVYNGKADLPQVFQIRRTLESVPGGGFSSAERKRLTDNLMRIAEQIWRLYQLHQAHTPRMSRGDSELHRSQLLHGDILPTTGVEALQWLGGYFSNNNVSMLQLGGEAVSHLLGSRSVNILLRESDQIFSLFSGLLSAFPEKSPDISREAWEAEVEGVWKALPSFRQNDIRANLSEDAQLLAQLIIFIGENSNDRVLKDANYRRQLQSGKAQPRSVIELLIWINGYFSQEQA